MGPGELETQTCPDDTKPEEVYYSRENPAPEHAYINMQVLLTPFVTAKIPI